MLNESLCAKENDKKVNSTSIKSQMPVLLMVSNGKGTGFGQEQWRHYATSFAKGQKIWKSLIMILLIISITIRPKR